MSKQVFTLEEMFAACAEERKLERKRCAEIVRTASGSWSPEKKASYWIANPDDVLREIEEANDGPR